MLVVYTRYNIYIIFLFLLEELHMYPCHACYASRLSFPHEGGGMAAGPASRPGFAERPGRKQGRGSHPD